MTIKTLKEYVVEHHRARFERDLNRMVRAIASMGSTGRLSGLGRYDETLQPSETTYWSTNYPFFVLHAKPLPEFATDVLEKLCPSSGKSFNFTEIVIDDYRLGNGHNTQIFDVFVRGWNTQ